MAIRTGMKPLLELLTDMTNPGSEFTLQEMQDVLDRNQIYFKYVMLTPDITRTSQLTAVYVDYFIDPQLGKWFEIPVLGEVNQNFYLESFLFEPIMWGVGETQATYNDNLKRISFNADQFGKYYFLSGLSFDLNGAAAEIWNTKVNNRQKFINVKTDNHTINLGDELATCRERYTYYTALSRRNSTSTFIRTDQSAGYSRNPMNLQRRGY